MAFRASWIQRQLADRLIELREQQDNMSIAAAAKAVGFSRFKLQRIERAEVQVEPRDVVRLCRVYRTSEEEMERLCEWAIQSRTDTWWDRYEQWTSPSYAAFIGYENEARRADTIQPVLLPGLLQTEMYARGLYAGSVMIPDPERVEGLVQVRMLRRRRLTEPEQPLELAAVIGEAALRKPYGGSQAFHMQLKYLRELMDLPNVSVRVVTLDRPVVFWPLETFEFESGGPAVVFTETLWGNLKHDGEPEIQQARRVIARVTQEALSIEDSTAFIEKRIKETAV